MFENFVRLIFEFFSLDILKTLYFPYSLFSVKKKAENPIIRKVTLFYLIIFRSCQCALEDFTDDDKDLREMNTKQNVKHACTD